MGLAWRAGGINKAFAVASLPGAGDSVRVLHTGLSVRGARKASEVGRVMSAHFQSFRACAQSSRLDGAQHRVQLELDISPDGSVTVLGASAAPLEQCVERAALGVSFEAGARGASQVVYPLYFTPATERLQPSRAVAPASVACDCAG
jgi:hypothetical protein